MAFGSNSQQQNEENMNSTAEEIETITAMKRQADSDVPVFVPPKPEPIVPTNDQIASSIAKMTLAENMARLSPTQLYLRNQLLSRTVMLNNPGFNPAPPLRTSCKGQAGGLLPIQTRETSMLPGAKKITANKPNKTREAATACRRAKCLTQADADDRKVRFRFLQAGIHCRQHRKNEVGLLQPESSRRIEGVQCYQVLRNPILKRFYVGMNAAYKSKPEDQLTIGDLNMYWPWFSR